jgi:molybdate transport system regulatory protein
MTLSARNRFAGEVTEVETGAVNTKVELELTDSETITAIITNDATDELELSEGDSVEAVIKAPNVMIDDGE